MVLDFPEAKHFIDDFGRHWSRDTSLKCVVLMRGLPGCGKTSFVEELVERADMFGIPSAVCSADHYFYGEDDIYRFNPRDLSTNHAKCAAKFRRCLLARDACELDFVNLIIVDNTNIRRDELDPYIREARQANVDFHSFRFKCRTMEEAATQCLRSMHCVPLDVTLRRYHDYTFRLEQNETEVSPKYIYEDAYRLEMRISNFD